MRINIHHHKQLHSLSLLLMASLQSLIPGNIRRHRELTVSGLPLHPKIRTNRSRLLLKNRRKEYRLPNKLRCPPRLSVVDPTTSALNSSSRHSHLLGRPHLDLSRILLNHHILTSSSPCTTSNLPQLLFPAK